MVKALTEDQKDELLADIMEAVSFHLPYLTHFEYKPSEDEVLLIARRALLSYEESCDQKRHQEHRSNHTP